MRSAHFRKSGRRRSGFTMMELLVVLGIFSTTVTMASDIFMMAHRAQRKVFALERTQADARFTMEAIIREIRGGSIDYGWYQQEGISLEEASSVSQMAVVDGEGRRIRFWKADEPQDCADEASTPCLRVSIQPEGGTASEAPMTPNGVKVVQCRFYISPKVDPTIFDPSTGTFSADAQPIVTVVLTMQSASPEPIQQTVVYFQSSAATRNYGR
jgi:prepilin-type N-terminal cleavage/methylation domain-containing protein